MKTKKIKTSVLKHVWEMISRGTPREEICRKLKLNEDDLYDQFEMWLEKQDMKETEQDRAAARVVSIELAKAKEEDKDRRR